MLDIFIVVGACILSAFLGCLATRWVLTRKTAYGYFYLEEIDPNEPGEYNIRISIPKETYYLDKNHIVLKRGNSQE